MSTSVDGVISGLDTTALIDSMVEIYATPKRNAESQIDELETRQEKLSELITLMGDFDDALDGVRHLADFREFGVTYENSDALSAEVDGLAVAGTYQVVVSQVATSEMEVSQGFADKSTTGELATGTFSVTYGSTTTEIAIDSDTSLSSLARSITEIDGLTAYVMNTGDATTPYRLVIQGDDTGSDNTITLDTSGLTGAGTVPTFTEQTTAQDAELTVNGIDVTSSSNVLDSAIPGMTLTLNDTTTDAINVVVSPDTDAIETKVSGLLDSYNAIVQFVKDNSTYDADAETRGAFVGDTSVQRVVQSLQSVITREFSDLGQDFDALSLVGISTDPFTGLLELDSDTFQDALASNPDEVANLFVGSGGFVETMVDKLDLFIDPYEGSLELRKDSLDERIDVLDEQVARYEDRITRYESRLRAQFTSLESLLGQLQGSSDYLAAMLYTSTG